MARKPRLFRASSFRKLKPGDLGYVSATATKYRILRGKRAGEIVSNAERITLIKGAHPSQLAAERKAGVRGYQSAASEAQAAKSVKTRRRFSRKGTWLHPDEVTGTHPFLNKQGREQSATFRGRDLAVMQTYREDVHGRFDKEGNAVVPGALQTGDGSALRKYDRMVIRDVNGVRVRPETNVAKLRRWWDGKTVRQRNEFEREMYYLTERAKAA